MQYFDKNVKEIKAGMKILMRNRKCDLDTTVKKHTSNYYRL